jgi:hypothetical protein
MLPRLNCGVCPGTWSRKEVVIPELAVFSVSIAICCLPAVLLTLGFVLVCPHNLGTIYNLSGLDYLAQNEAPRVPCQQMMRIKPLRRLCRLH